MPVMVPGPIVAVMATIGLVGLGHDLDRDALCYTFGKIDIVDSSTQGRCAHLSRDRRLRGAVECHVAGTKAASGVPQVHIIATEHS